jgi:hypothetical protein
LCDSSPPSRALDSLPRPRPCPGGFGLLTRYMIISIKLIILFSIWFSSSIIDFLACTILGFSIISFSRLLPFDLFSLPSFCLYLCLCINIILLIILYYWRYSIKYHLVERIEELVGAFFSFLSFCLPLLLLVFLSSTLLKKSPSFSIRDKDHSCVFFLLLLSNILFGKARSPTLALTTSRPQATASSMVGPILPPMAKAYG